MSDPTRGGQLPPLTGDPSQDLGPAHALPALSGDVNADLSGVVPHDFHAEYASGAMGRRMAAANARDQANLRDQQASQPGLIERAAGNVLNTFQGIPGVERLEAGAGALGSQLTSHPMDYGQSLATLRGATAQIPAPLRIGEQIVGAAPIAGFLPGGVVKGGAAYGALQGALGANQESIPGRAGQTALGGLVGGATGLLAKGAGKLASKTGLTDALGRVLRTPQATSTLEMQGGAETAPSLRNLIGETIGTQGAANRVLDARQQILDQLSGSEKSAAQTMMDHVDAYKANAKTLYEAARNTDPTVFARPEVQNLVQNPDLQPFFQEARAALSNGPNPVEVAPGIVGQPRLAPNAAPPPPTVPSGAPTSLREAIAAFQDRMAIPAQRNEGTTMQQIARGALERRSAESTLPSVRGVIGATAQEPVAARAAQVVDVPTPEEVSLVKRTLDAIARRKILQTGMSPAQAIDLGNKADALRSALHDASPEWKDADTYYSQAKNFETAFQKAYGVQKRVTASALTPGKLRSPEAVNAYVERATGPMQDVRRAGQAAGAAGRIAEDVRNMPIGTAPGQQLRGVLSPFDPAAAQVRAPAFNTPEDAQAFAQLLGRQNAEGGPPSHAPFHAYLAGHLPGVHFFGRPEMPWATGPLATSGGQELRAALAAKMASEEGRRELMAQVLRYRQGLGLLRQGQPFPGIAGVAATGIGR